MFQNKNIKSKTQRFFFFLMLSLAWLGKIGRFVHTWQNSVAFLVVCFRSRSRTLQRCHDAGSHFHLHRKHLRSGLEGVYLHQTVSRSCEFLLEHKR